MANYVRGEGGPNAKLMIVGEAPGYYEDLYGIPFYPNAPSGGELNWFLTECGLTRNDVYITNVLKYRPPNNKWKERHETNPKDEESLKILQDEIQMVNPNCILAVGEKALQALVNDKYKMRHYRGSVLESKTLLPKVVPMYHPSVYLHEKGSAGRTPFKYIYRYICLFDFKRAVEQARFPDIRRPYRLLTIAKDFADVYRFFEENKNKSFVSLDIESHNCFPFCIGLAFSKDRAISIPLFNTIGNGTYLSSIPVRELARIWKFLNQELPKKQIIGQNLKYDQDKLEKIGFKLGPLYIDTLLLGHAVNPEFPVKKLEFWTSYYTEEPYYKDEGSGYNPKKDKIDRLLLYNAKDAAVTFEVAEKMEDEAKEINVWNFYYNKRRPLHQFYLDIENHGFRVNSLQRKKIYKKYRLLEEQNNSLLAGILGKKEFNLASNPQVHEALYKILSLPYRKDAKEETLVALLANHCKQDHQREFVQGLLDGRRIKKTIRTYIKAKPDFDGRMRTSYNIVGTVTGRSSTRKLKPPIRPLYPTGTKKKGKVVGLAFHTLTKHGKLGPDLRSYLTPDEGKILWEIDKKQAEAYVVFLLGEDYSMLNRLKDPSFDIHTFTTHMVGIAPSYEEAKKKEPRFIGKTVRHMCGYDAHKRKLMLEINTNAKRFNINVNISEWKAGKYLDAFHNFSPNIRKVFHPAVIEALENNGRTLINPFGARIQFHERWDDDLLRSAYAWIPQSTIPDHVRDCSLRALKYRDLEIIIEAHDALIGQCKPDEAEDIWKLLDKEFSVPISFNSCSIKRGDLVIPNDFKVYVGSYNPKDEMDLKEFKEKYV